MRWACIAIWLCACSRTPAGAGAFVLVTVDALTSSAQITRVSVTVMPANVSADLTRDPAGTFSGTLTVPATGPQTVTASAWAGTTLAASGSGSVVVAKGQTAQLFITALDATGPVPLPDHSPVVTSLAASTTTVALGGNASLVATAVDADGDAITFGWSAAPAGCGTFAAPGSASTTWTAAAVGVCAVTLTASARGKSDSRSTNILVNAPTPTLAQHVGSSSNDNNGIRGNAFKFTLPNPVGSGNCLVLGISYAWAAGRTVSIADSTGNTWPSSPAVTTTDGATLISSIFVLPNANSGLTTITVTFDAPLKPFQYTVSEFYNVATASPVNGTSNSHSTAAPNVAAGSFTPGNNDANGGNLVWSYFIDQTNIGAHTASAVVSTGSATLLDANITWTIPSASQSFVQTTAGAINPGVTVTQGTNDTFNALAVALQAANAGTPPAATGIRIVRVLHLGITAPLGNGATFQVPTSGNLIVLSAWEQNLTNITSVTDSNGNTYTKRAFNDSCPSFWYAGNATPGATLTLTVANANYTGDLTIQVFDIMGADPSPFDGIAGTNQSADTNGANLSNTPSITPVSAPGLTLASLSLGQGPSSGLGTGSPTGAVFDYVYYTGETDFDLMDNADGRAHFYNSDLSTENWNWIVANGAQTTTYSATAVHFKSAPPH